MPDELKEAYEKQNDKLDSILEEFSMKYTGTHPVDDA